MRGTPNKSGKGHVRPTTEAPEAKKVKFDTELRSIETTESSDEPQWIVVQKKSFLRWVNNQLLKKGDTLDDLVTGLKDGIKLHDLLEIVSQKTFNVNRKPRFKIQSLENLSWCFDFLKVQGVKIVGIGASDVHDGDSKLILGLIWTIILRYHVAENDGSKVELLAWIRSKIPECSINNFQDDWKDGKAICALVDAINPTNNKLEGTDGSPAHDIDLAMQKANKDMSIPLLLDSQDMASGVDELSNVMYLSCFRNFELQNGEKQALPLPPPPPTVSVEHSTIVDHQVSFTVSLFDNEGQKVSSDNNVDVQVSGPKGSKISNVEVKEEDAVMFVTFKVTDFGEYVVSVKANGEHIQGSPFKQVFTASK